MDGNLTEVKAQPDVIFFDAAGTLIHLNQPVGWHYSEVAGRHGLEVSPEVINAAFQTVWKEQKERTASSGPREQDDKFWWKGLAIKTLDRSTGVPSSFDRDAWFEEVYDRFEQPGIWGLYDDARRCLDRHRGKVRMAVISNFDRRLRRILAHLDVERYFEHLIISSEVGCDKPDQGIYLRGLATMAVKAEQCLHVGDDPEKDWAGAATAGLRVFRLERPLVTLDDLSPEDPSRR